MADLGFRAYQSSVQSGERKRLHPRTHRLMYKHRQGAPAPRAALRERTRPAAPAAPAPQQGAPAPALLDFKPAADGTRLKITILTVQM